MDSLWSFITDFFTNLGGFWVWLNTPIRSMCDTDFLNFVGGLGDFGSWINSLLELKPIGVIGIGGISICLVFWIIHLVRVW